MIKVPSYLIEPWRTMVISYTNNKRLELIKNHYGVQFSETQITTLYKVFFWYKEIIMLMLMLMPVSAGPAESQTCSRAIVVMALTAIPRIHAPTQV